MPDRNVTLIRRPRRPVARPFIQALDIWTVAWLALVLGITVTVTARWQWKLCRTFAFISLVSRRARRGTAIISAMCGLTRNNARAAIRSLYASRIFRDFNLISGILREPRQKITFVGFEHLLRALESKHGAVLWMADFVEAGDITKIGFHSRGLPISHLSRPEHGFSGSRFAIKWLNPIRTRYENRFLAKRVMFDREHPQTAHACLAAILERNGIVCITASQHEGVSLAETEFLNGRICLATGAPRTAYRARCPILPVFVLRDRNELLAYSMIIEHPLNLSNAIENYKAVMRATADFVERLERYVAAYPEMWVGWRRLGLLTKD